MIPDLAAETVLSNCFNPILAASCAALDAIFVPSWTKFIALLRTLPTSTRPFSFTEPDMWVPAWLRSQF